MFIIFILGPSPPNNLSTQSLNSTAILVSWDAPTNPNGKIKYRLSFRRGSEPKASFKLVYDGDLTHHLVSNLNPFTLYNFKVNAYNVKYNLSSSSVFAMETTDQAGKFMWCYIVICGLAYHQQYLIGHGTGSEPCLSHPLIP